MCLSPAEVPCVVITSVLLFKSILYCVIRQICFCIRKHLCVLISFFLLKSLGSCLLYTGRVYICGNKACFGFAVWTKKRNFGS